jgi:hypothetical protein
MVNIFKRNDEEQYDEQDEESLLVLQDLEKEEFSLMEEKRELLALKEKLQLKAQEAIEMMKHRIQTLKDEISELKQQCEQLESYVSSS